MNPKRHHNHFTLFRYIFDRKRPYYYVEFSLAVFIVIFSLSAGNVSAIATKIGALGAVIFLVELAFRNDLGRFAQYQAPILTFVFFTLQSVLLHPLIPEAIDRVRNNITSMILISMIFFIVRRNGKAPLLEFSCVIPSIFICVMYTFFRHMLTPLSRSAHRMRFGLEVLGHGSGAIGATGVSLIIGVSLFFSLHLLLSPEFRIFSKSWRWVRLFLWGNLLLGSYCILVYTGSRQGAIWVVLALISWIVLTQKTSLFFGLLCATCLALITGFIMFTFFEDLVVVERITVFFDPLRQFEEEDSFEGRMIFIQDGLRLWRQSPIWGNGNEAFRAYGAGMGTYSHNNYVELLANYGILGIFFFYIPFLVALIGSWIALLNSGENQRQEYIWVICIIVSMLVSNFVLPSYYMRSMQFLFTYALGIFWFQKQDRLRRIHPPLHPPDL